MDINNSQLLNNLFTKNLINTEKFNKITLKIV